MAGRKQHYIPQFILKGFARGSGGKKSQVVVFDQSGRTFAAATDGVAAARYFYSLLNVEGDEPTLDDSITLYEGSLAVLVARLRTVTAGNKLSMPGVVKLVVHLGLRNANTRKTVSFAAEEMFGLMGETLETPERLRALLELDAANPTETIRASLEKVLDQLPNEITNAFQNRGQAMAWAYEKLQNNFDAMFDETRTELSQIFQTVVDNLENFAADSHVKALSKSLAPEQRVEALRDMVWTCETVPGDCLLMPDCVVIGREYGGPYLPTILFDSAKVDELLMPISSSHILVGRRGHAPDDFAELNRAIAACSWDFFVGGEFLAAHKRLIPLIRTATVAEARRQTGAAWIGSQ